MKFKDHGAFSVYDHPDSPFGPRALHARNDDGVDFYDLAYPNGEPAALCGFLIEAGTGIVRSAVKALDELFPAGFILVTTASNAASTDLVGAVDIGAGSHVWDGAAIAPAPAAQEIAIANRVQIELWLNANGFPGGFENADIIAAADAVGDEAKIRLRSGQRFRSDDPFLTTAAPALGIEDLHAAVAAASML